MRIPKKTWNKYITDLRKISDKAAELMTSYLETHDVSSPAGRQQAIEYAYALATKYGEGTSALACEMYDSVVAASGKRLPPAEPAATATFNEVARTVNGSMLYSKRPDVIGSSVGRLVKTAGVDTTMRNAIRDGAEWAWIPSGDSCAFCLALASQGWVKASEKVMKGNHAEHIHNNCDCTFSIRFDGKSSVEGYDPDALRRQYYAADGSTPTERINAMRRANYAANKDAINAQKRNAYARRNALQSGNNRAIMRIDTGGQRNETPLTNEQIKACYNYAESLGMPRDHMGYSENYWTSYNSEYDVLLIGTDVFPGDDATTANGKLDYMCALAHEIIGHRGASKNGVTDFPKDDPRDEAQASIRAARFTPGLTKEQRRMLIRDAIDRLHNGGYRLKDVKHLLDISSR